MIALVSRLQLLFWQTAVPFPSAENKYFATGEVRSVFDNNASSATLFTLHYP
jgi:hypothetical protein